MIHTLQTSRVLLIEKDGSTARRVCEALAKPGMEEIEMECAQGLSEGLDRLCNNRMDAILLELSLFDTYGIETFDQFYAAAGDVPILVLGETSDALLAAKAVGRGAQDYLLLEHLDGYSLSRAVRNAIDRKTNEGALFLEKEQAAVTLDSIGDAVLCTDVSGRITYLNLVAETMTGWNRDEARGRPLIEVFEIVDGLTRKAARDPLAAAIELGRTVSLTENCILIRRDGEEFAIEDSAAPIHNRLGEVIGAVIVFHDVSETRAISSRVAYLAEHDILTGLPNRLLLNDRITQAISLARHHRRRLAVMFLDLDHFKHINDTMGHANGDALLRAIAKRLVGSVRSSDTVSRQGGDEFVILLSEIAHADDAATSAEKLIQSIYAPYSIDGRELHISGSIGISIYPDHGKDAETLIKFADMAMYHAKQSGRNTFQIFQSAMNAEAVRRQTIEDGLYLALDRNEFRLHYQPIVNLHSGHIEGVEALLRWQHPEEGLVHPDFFVEVAEECGLLIRIGKWVQREACRQGSEWQGAGLPAMLVAINVSAIEFNDKSFVRDIRAVLAESGLAANSLKIELTEGALMKRVETTLAVLKELKDIGVQLAVDDFGTGYSSLKQLRQFPINVLKIDRSFVQQITDDSDDCAIVSAIIGVGQSLGFLIVAEGIETQVQSQYLQSKNCSMGQGYLFSRPLPAAEIAHLVQSGRDLRV